MDKVSYKDVSYPAKELDIPDFGHNLISVESLEDALIVGLYTGESIARAVDEEILFYVPDDIISLSDDKVIDYVVRNII